MSFGEKIMNFRNFHYAPVILAMTAGIALSAYTLNAGAEISTAIGSDVSGSELRALTIESWDRDYTARGYGWEVHTNRDNTYQVENVKDYDPEWAGTQAERAVKLVRGTPRDIKENIGFDKAYVLGIKFAFTFPGDNIVTLRPPYGVDHYVVERPRPYLNELAFGATKKGQASCFQNPSLARQRRTERPQVIDCVRGIEMPGKVQAISIWVNGRGNEYDLEGWIEDWRGDTHILKFGSLDFVGWRPMTAKIPTSVPQEVASFPQIKTLVFKQFKIRARPGTSLETVYLFFDELRILTDIFEVHFDGAQIDFDQDDCLQKDRLLAIIRRYERDPQSFESGRDCSKAPGKVAPIPEITPKETGGSGGGGQTQKPKPKKNP